VARPGSGLLGGDRANGSFISLRSTNNRDYSTVELLGRANTQARPQSRQAGYYLTVNDTGAWSLSKKDTAGTATALAGGTASAPGTGTWHTPTLRFTTSRRRAAGRPSTIRCC
jgi:hypothetical protein